MQTVKTVYEAFVVIDGRKYTCTAETYNKAVAELNKIVVQKRAEKKGAQRS